MPRSKPKPPRSFNADHAALARRKRADADRIADHNTRLAELERELAKLSLTPLNPPISAVPAAAPAAPGSGAHAARRSTGGAEGAGPVAVAWADVEDLEEALFKLRPGEVQVRASTRGL
jgi:hypothetical protein